MTAPVAISDDPNPVAVLADLWTSARYGLGLPSSRLDTTNLAAIASSLNTEGLGLSPVITRSDTFRSFLIQLCECLDAYLASDAAGRLQLKLARDCSPVLTLDETGLVEPPELLPQTWADTPNETYVRFTNRLKKFKEDSVAYRDRGNFMVTGAITTQQLTRDWVTCQAVASKIAWPAGRAAALPLASGSGRVHRQRVAALQPGNLFSLTFAQSGITNLVCRLERKRVAPGQAEATIEFREERGWLNSAGYVPAEDAVTSEVVWTTAALAYQACVELPWAITETETPRLAFLASRGDGLSTGFNVWFQRMSGSYANLAMFDRFACRGHVVADYPANTLLIDDTTLFDVQLDSVDNVLDKELALEDALAGQLLIFAGNEILSGFALSLLGTGHYKPATVRARADTKRVLHPAGEEVFIVLTSFLPSFTAPRIITATYKLQPFILQHELDLASITPRNVSITWRALRPMRPLNLRVNGDGANPTYTTGQDIPIAWHASDPRRPVTDPTVVLAPPIEATVIEVRTTGDVLKGTFTFPGATSPRTITNAQLVAALGSETDFKLRGYFQRGALRSREYDEITVKKT